MQNLKRIIECKEGRRCNSPLSCKSCGENWRRAKFKGFAECLPSVLEDSDIITYLVIKPIEFLSLRAGVELMYQYLDRLREEKKRGRLPIMYSRLEVSFGKKNLGFNPHLNILCFDDPRSLINIADSFGLKIWHKKKEHNRDTALSIAWYMLKFNNIGIEKGEAVRRTLNRRSQLIHSKEFNHKAIDYINEYIDIDFSFMGVYPIRTKEEIRIRDKMREERKKLNAKFKRLLEKARRE